MAELIGKAVETGFTCGAYGLKRYAVVLFDRHLQAE